MRALRIVPAVVAAIGTVGLGLATPASATASTAAEVAPQKTHFDLQAHRGGIGMTTEESLQGFAKAMRLGVSTLELDTQITKDEKVVVNHDRQISAQKCRDTGPAFPGDPMYPYVGKYIKDLTLAQIKTMDCGYQQLPGFPEQEQVKGFRMVELKDVLNLVKAYHANQVTLNIETKVEAGAPEQTAPRELFVRRVFEEIHASGIERQVTIQSFDWGALKEMHRLAPTLAARRADELRLPPGRQAGGLPVARRHRRRRLRRRLRQGGRGRGPRPHRALAELRLPAERQGRRPRLPLLPRQGDGLRGARPRAEGHPVDLRRPRHDQGAHGHGRRRHHHQLPEPRPATSWPSAACGCRRRTRRPDLPPTAVPPGRASRRPRGCPPRGRSSRAERHPTTGPLALAGRGDPPWRACRTEEEPCPQTTTRPHRGRVGETPGRQWQQSPPSGCPRRRSPSGHRTWSAVPSTSTCRWG